MNKEEIATQKEQEILPFDLETKKTILEIINDSPSLVKMGDKEFMVRNMRYYSVYRICQLVMDMKKGDESLDTDEKVIMALCTDLDAMCEIMAIILCNHLFVPDDGTSVEGSEKALKRNNDMVYIMKEKVMNSTYDINQWAAIIIGAIKSIDLGGFFLLKKSVSTLTDSLLTRKKKQEETASQFMEALSLLTQQTSSEPTHNTD